MSLRIKGQVWKFGDNISTDLMMPGFFRSQGLSEKEMAKYVMYSNRPGWAEQVRQGDIIVAGRNWGCGSSRPAPRLFKALGIAGVVADSLSRLFFRNSVNIGFPVLICSGVSQAFEEGEEAEIDFEVGTVSNLTREAQLQGEAIAVDSPPYQILQAGGLRPFLEQVIASQAKNKPEGKS